MSAHLGERLSAYVDGELDGAALAEADYHLATCDECRRAVDDLRRLVRRAGALDDRPPEHDLWDGIAARLGGQVVPLASRRRRFAFSIPQLAAAAVALMALSAGSAMLLSRAPRAPGLVEVSPVRAVGGFSAPAVASYDAAIRDLETTLEARRSTLDTGTVRAVEQSLAVIDRAIRQAEAALRQDPNSLYLNSHLEDALSRKLDVLRRVTSMVVAS